MPGARQPHRDAQTMIAKAQPLRNGKKKVALKIGETVRDLSQH